MKRFGPVVLALLASGVVSQALAQPAKIAATAKGEMLQAPNGMTLYVLDRDVSGQGKSTCNGDCAKLWPPLAVSDGSKATGDWSVIARDDGTSQWAYKGRPLYTWSKDTKPGETSGDNFAGGKWHVARP